MIQYLPFILIGIFALIIIVFFVKTIKNYYGTTPKDKKKKPRHKDRNQILKEANRRLSQNPKDAEALESLGELYFQEQAWEKAFKTYQILMDLATTNPDIDEFTTNLRYGIAAMKLKKHDEAYKSLVVAQSIKKDVFEINYNLGYLEYTRKNYEKSVNLLRLAVQQDPEHAQALRYFGLALFKIKKYPDAYNYLSRALNLEPDDKEAMFAMAECNFELGKQEQALKIFTHLRPDPALGPNAALYAGTINVKLHNYKKAIMDFEIGLKHHSAPPKIQVELRYRLALVYIQQMEIGRALALFKEIQQIAPNYKDVPVQIKKYSELHEHKHLQTFLLAQISEFIALCRKITTVLIPRTKVKIIDISVSQNEYVDILAEVHSSKWEDLILYRYIRTNGAVGELLIRDLYSKLKDSHAGRGFAITMGHFSDDSKRFVEARLIDLIEKDKLVQVLQKLDAAVPRMG